MRKLLLITLFTLTFAGSSKAGWFSNDDRETQELKIQIQNDQQHDRLLNGVILVLAVGCVANLCIGASIGSKARNAEGKEQP